MLPSFLQRSSDFFGDEHHPLSLRVWRLNINLYSGESGKKARLLKGFARSNWTGMNLSSVSPFEWETIRNLAKSKTVVAECFGVHDAEVDGEFQASCHMGLWMPAQDYEFWIDALKTIPPRHHLILVGAPVPALTCALQGLNWMVSPRAGESTRLLSVQDSERLPQIRALARLSFC